MASLLIALALFKVQKFLAEGLRLRTACDLEAVSITAKKPAGFTLPSLKDIAANLPALIEAVASENKFANPAITSVSYKGDKK